MTHFSKYVPPTGPCLLSMQHYDSLKSAVYEPIPISRKLAWVLRRLADRIDGKESYVVELQGPSTISGTDLVDGLARGVNAASRYLNELHRDRSSALEFEQG